MADSGVMAVKKIMGMLSGTYIALAIKNSMVLILNMAAIHIIWIKDIPALGW